MTEWCLWALSTPGIWHALQRAARMSSIIEIFQKNQYVKPLIRPKLIMIIWCVNYKLCRSQMKLINSMLMRHHAVRGLLACLELIIVSDPLILPTVNNVISTGVWGRCLLTCVLRKVRLIIAFKGYFLSFFFFSVWAATIQTSSFSLLCVKGWYNARMKLLFKCFPLYLKT